MKNPCLEAALQELDAAHRRVHEGERCRACASGREIVRRYRAQLWQRRTTARRRNKDTARDAPTRALMSAIENPRD